MSSQSARLKAENGRRIVASLPAEIDKIRLALTRPPTYHEMLKWMDANEQH